MQSQNRVLFICFTAIVVICLVMIVAFFVTTCVSAINTSSDNEIQTETNDITNENEPVSITLTFAGDCTLGTDEFFDYDSSFNSMFEEVENPSWFFENVSDIFANDDLTIVNMEGTLTTATEREDKTYAFKGNSDYAQVLVDGNVEATSLANNHSYDYGEQSYEDTIATLEDASIETFGYDRIAYFDVKGVKVALIGTYELDEGIEIQDEMLSNIQHAQEEGAQLIAVFAHWGMEYETVPDDTQIELAHAAVDAGADIVIGSHPHVIQGYEKYHGRYIEYSLGNFCFGGNSNPSDKDCLIFRQTFTVDGDVVTTDDNIEVIPCSVSSTSDYNNYQPTPAQGSEKERIDNKIDESNEAIAVRSRELEAE